jgi:hypothetical protein
MDKNGMIYIHRLLETKGEQMSKTARILLVTVLVSLFLALTVFTAGAQAGDCQPDFMLHMAHEHDEHHAGHMHVGTDADRNGDGYICVKHVTPFEKIHVHIDNNLK